MSFGKSLAVACVTSLACSIFGDSAHAEPSVALNHYRAGEMAGDDFALRSAGVGPHLELGAQLTLDYSRNSLTFSNADGKSVAIVRDQLTANASASFALFERVAVFAGLPVNLIMAGDSLTGVPDADGAGVGDPYFGARVRLLGTQEDVFRLGAQMLMTVPVANAANQSQRYTGEIGTSYLPQANADLSLPYGVGIGANLGVRLRALDNATVVRELDISHELVWALGGSVPVLDMDEHRLTAHAQLFGRNTLDHFSARELTTVEGLLGVRYRHPSHLQVGLAASSGLVNGYGAPEVRVLATAAFTGSIARAAATVAPPNVVQVAPEAIPEPVKEPVVEEPRVEAPVVEPPVAQQPIVPVIVEPQPPPSDRDQDGLPDVDDRCPDVAATSDGLAGCPRVALSDIPFANGTSDLSQRARTLLLNVVEQLRNAPGATLRIEGHADNRGSAETNQVLSDRRSASVRQWLVAHGIEEARITTTACGFTAPIATGDDAASRAANRRVHFVIVPAGSDPPRSCQP